MADGVALHILSPHGDDKLTLSPGTGRLGEIAEH